MSLKKQADVVLTVDEFRIKFPIGHMRRAIGDGNLRVLGYYTFLDPENSKKTFVS